VEVGFGVLSLSSKPPKELNSLGFGANNKKIISYGTRIAQDLSM
jgi:hypothetical protein